MDKRVASDTTTISDVEAGIERALEEVRMLDQRGRLPQELKPLVHLAPPEGASVHVSLRKRESSRPIRRAAPADSFVQRLCGAWIVYEMPTALDAQDPGDKPDRSESGNPLEDFIAALDRAERDPHLSFVSLKWFRDTYLAKRGYAWARDPDLPRRLVQETTERGLIVTSKVDNPKTPEFPVTSIRLNRQHPDVRKVLGTTAVPGADAGSASG
jgi:hypothetical protein